VARRKLLNVFALLAISLCFATGVVAADYIGPDRVHTETSYEVCEYGVWAHEGNVLMLSTTQLLAQTATGNAILVPHVEKRNIPTLSVPVLLNTP